MELVVQPRTIVCRSISGNEVLQLPMFGEIITCIVVKVADSTILYIWAQYLIGKGLGARISEHNVYAIGTVW